MHSRANTPNSRANYVCSRADALIASALPLRAIDLRRALEALPHRERLLLVLRYYLDLSYDEVGAVIGTSAKAAKSRTHRALVRLRLAPEVGSP